MHCTDHRDHGENQGGGQLVGEGEGGEPAGWAGFAGQTPPSRGPSPLKAIGTH
ncbi:hypothetical protein [Streptomyces mesophilus]|uniref:hypothetical protein n=1 Tax=Streptomyces mesophilus TaxID=1775132 RepID=UPI002E2B2228|nr:hypothetical protein [Streptomyces mesophilus]